MIILIIAVFFLYNKFAAIKIIKSINNVTVNLTTKNICVLKLVKTREVLKALYLILLIVVFLKQKPQSKFSQF